jgi:hypothetical protein
MAWVHRVKGLLSFEDAQTAWDELAVLARFELDRNGAEGIPHMPKSKLRVADVTLNMRFPFTESKFTACREKLQGCIGYAKVCHVEDYWLVSYSGQLGVGPEDPYGQHRELSLRLKLRFPLSSDSQNYHLLKRRMAPLVMLES